MRRPDRQRGLTLVEIMVAMVIGLVLMGGVLQMFVSSKQSYRMQDAMSRIQENGRFAVDLLAREVRGADAWGCGGSGRYPITNSSGSAVVDDLLNATGVSGVDNGIRDALSLGGVSGPGVPVISDTVTMPDAFNISSTRGFAQGGLAIISDCEKGEIFRIANINANGTGLTPEAGSLDFDRMARVYPLKFNRYFIDNSSGTPTLQQQPLFGGNSQPLIDGIEAMQVLYGEDTSGDRVPDAWLPFDGVSNPAEVMALRVHLLVQSAEDNIATRDSKVYFIDAVHASADRRLRQAFTTTIGLRNRGWLNR